MKNKTYVLGVGPPKTGTTFLYKVFKKYAEDAFLPQKKELSFFNYVDVFQFPNESLTLNVNLHKARLKREKLNALKAMFKIKNAKYALNYLKLLNNAKSTANTRKYFNYLNLESKNKNIILDFSPEYCIINDRIIESITELNLNVKVILTLRNPVEREWSNARFVLHKIAKNPISNFDEKQMKKFLYRYHPKSDYIKIINKWKKYVKPENMLILFFDEFILNPDLYIDKITSFLKIKPFKIKHQKAINKSPIKKMPKDFEIELYKKHFNKIIELLNLFEGENKKYVNIWLQKAKLILNKN